jgi:hypothetical protein
MPEDIRRYLAFLQGVERQRKLFEGQVANQMLTVIPNLMAPNFDADNVQPPDRELVQRYAFLARQYAQATVRFQAAARRIRVPMACRVLHANYSYALSRNPAMIMQTAQCLSSGNFGGLLQLRGSVGADIGSKFATADMELGRICGQYDMRKPFSIGDSGSGTSLFGF